jgi:hypothetical protein
VREVDGNIWNRVEGILNSGVRLGLATTGGGSELISWLLNHPGASRAVLEAQVPYCTAALGAYLGAPGPHPAEVRTAVEMAGKAYVRGCYLAGSEEGVIGLGCTAALATGRARRGEDRGHIALRRQGEYRIYSLYFDRGAADRIEQEDLLSRLGLRGLGEACGECPEEGDWPNFAEVKKRTLSLDDPLELIFREEVGAVEIDVEGNACAEVEREGRLLFSGSFNPLHRGHVQLAKVASNQCRRPVCMEISLENVDKPPLSRDEMEHRVEQFRGRLPVVVTRVPTFVEKARLFGGCTFVIGYDTAVRLFQGKYYEGGEEGMENSLEEMATGGCHFLVAGRLHESVYRTLESIEVPERWRKMLSDIPEKAFRMDVSSTEIRRGNPS